MNFPGPGGMTASRRQILTSLGGLAGVAVLTGCAHESMHRDSGVVIPPTFATGEAAQKEAALAAGAPTLYMVSALDCPNCTLWHASDEPGFLRSEARARLKFVVMNSYTIRQGSGADSIWPPDYRWIRDAAAADRNTESPPNTAWTPLWVLVRGHTYIVAAHGLQGWKKFMWPAIQRETGTA